MASDKPPNSTNADCDLLQRVKHLLDQQGYVPQRTLEISVDRSVVVVQGRVPSFYVRQIAIECIKRVAGVTHVVDRIKVFGHPIQRQSSVNSDDDLESSESSICCHTDLQDTVQTTGQDAPHAHHNQQNRLTSARG